jgi:hypothetical protein
MAFPEELGPAFFDTRNVSVGELGRKQGERGFIRYRLPLKLLWEEGPFPYPLFSQSGPRYQS